MLLMMMVCLHHLRHPDTMPWLPIALLLRGIRSGIVVKLRVIRSTLGNVAYGIIARLSPSNSSVREGGVGVGGRQRRCCGW